MPKKQKNIASEIMRKLNPTYIEPFTKIFQFLSKNPNLANHKQITENINSTSYVERMAKHYVDGFKISAPLKPQHTLDPVVDIILHSYYGIYKHNLADVDTLHRQSVAAENIIGTLLEHYFAQTLTLHGWFFCAGNIINGINFIKPNDDNTWTALQVSNENNNAMPSSLKVKDNVKLKKWYRIDSISAETRWDKFAENLEQSPLSEQDFQAFVANYCLWIRT